VVGQSSLVCARQSDGLIAHCAHFAVAGNFTSRNRRWHGRRCVPVRQTGHAAREQRVLHDARMQIPVEPTCQHDRMSSAITLSPIRSVRREEIENGADDGLDGELPFIECNVIPSSRTTDLQTRNTSSSVRCSSWRRSCTRSPASFSTMATSYRCRRLRLEKQTWAALAEAEAVSFPGM